ncbi:MAG: hypothetical protein FWD82_03515 [Defluviitaleaceae bacterium]|nr:hypothetical protein [Defluviitaleaceae bacterium]
MKNNVFKLCLAGLLIAIGTMIPMFAPRVLLTPASFTLAVHTVIFVAMFISPSMAVAVALGTTVGFQFTAVPTIVVLRALTHVIFALAGSYYLHRVKVKRKKLSFVKLRFFSFWVGLLHAACEVVVVSIFYFGGNMAEAWYSGGFFTSVLLLVGLGSVIHSMVDFEIANVIVNVLKRQKKLSVLFEK